MQDLPNGWEDMEYELACKVVLVSPPIGIGFCLQKGRAQLVDYVLSDGADIAFQFTVRVKEQKDGSPNFLGLFTQGKPSDRFVYICIGQRAGQAGAFANGRAKVRLTGIDWTKIKQVSQGGDGVLVARYEATGRSGAPATGTVALLDGGWQSKA